MYLPPREPILELQPQLVHTVNYDNPSEVPGAINTLFTGITLPTNFGSPTDFWAFLENKYGMHFLLPEYTIYTNTPPWQMQNHYQPSNPKINFALSSIFLANDAKYTRLLSSINEKYDVLAPYNIQEEHSTGEKVSDYYTDYKQRTNNEYETSMDSTSLQQTGQSTLGSHKDVFSYENNKKTTFAGNDFEDGSTSTQHTKDSRVGNIGNHSFAELIEKEIKLARYNLWDIVSNDIIDMICYKIFATSC
jgi:hypothetical protein